MALRPIRLLGDDVLRKKAKKVEKINTFIKNLLDDMADTMYKNNGVGLAGNQVGVLKRVIVVDDGNGLLHLSPKRQRCSTLQQVPHCYCSRYFLLGYY